MLWGGGGWWTQEGCLCQLGSGPGKGGEIKGGRRGAARLMRGKEEHKRKRPTYEEKKEKAGQVEKGGPRFCVAEGPPSKCQSNVHMTKQ